MDWSPSAIDAWEAMRKVEQADHSVWIGPALVALMQHTLPSSALRAALHDRKVWPAPENIIHGRVQETSGFMAYDLPSAAEEAAQNERARRVSERHIAMALAARGQAAFNTSGLQVDKLVVRVRDLELGPGFDRSHIAGRWHGLIDTSIAIEYVNLPEIDWVVETGSHQVTIWISPVLLDELDNAKFNSRNDRVKKRAQAWTRWIGPLLKEAVSPNGVSLPARPGVVLRAWAPALEETAPDSRHLEAAFALMDRQVPVKLITGDSGQRLRALAKGIEVFDLDDRWLLPSEEAEEQARMARLAEQRRADIRPRLRDRFLAATPERVLLSVYNVGGAAPHFVWIGCSYGRLYVCQSSVPEHFTEYMPIGPTDLGVIPADNELAKVTAQTLWTVAKDIDGDWWECASDVRVGRDPRAFIAGELKRRNLDPFAGRVFEVGRLE